MRSGPAAAFAGRWRVDQPAHALYEATLYDFRQDGRIEIVRTYGAAHLASTFEVGTVADPRTNTRCALGGAAWSARDVQTLLVTASCSDGRPREVVLRFRGGTGGDLMTPEIVSVGGEPGWHHPGFQWAFTKCDTPARCSAP